MKKIKDFAKIEKAREALLQTTKAENGTTYRMNPLITSSVKSQFHSKRAALQRTHIMQRLHDDITANYDGLVMSMLIGGFEGDYKRVMSAIEIFKFMVPRVKEIQDTTETTGPIYNSHHLTEFIEQAKEKFGMKDKVKELDVEAEDIKEVKVKEKKK